MNCGGIKFGALVPCPDCEAPATGNLDLDIMFSDHNISEPKLRELGEVIKEIAKVAPNDAVTFWTFIRYISEHQSHILSAEVPQAIAAEVEQTYNAITFPDISLEDSEEDS